MLQKKAVTYLFMLLLLTCVTAAVFAGTADVFIVVAINGTGILLSALGGYISGKRSSSDESYKGEIKDPLTGLLSREYTEKNIAPLFNDEKFCREACLAIVDIDFFKDVNNAYGRNVGDEALARLAEIISKHFRLTDIFARWGSDKFMVILNTGSTVGAHRAFERLREKLEKTEIKAGKHKLCITVTIGFAWCGDSLSFSDCVAKSEQALQEGKANGYNIVVDHAELSSVSALQSGLRL